MPKKSAHASIVRRAAPAVPAATAADLERLRSAMRGPVDTSDIPERKGVGRRVKRDASGRLPRPSKGPIREAILAELDRREMSRYALWKEARELCETLPQSAVYEYLRGSREIGVNYAEALIGALGLGISRQQRAHIS